MNAASSQQETSSPGTNSCAILVKESNRPRFLICCAANHEDYHILRSVNRLNFIATKNEDKRARLCKPAFGPADSRNG